MEELVERIGLCTCACVCVVQGVEISGGVE